MQAILPYLFVLACPVGMGLMMFFMLRMMRQPQQPIQPPLNPIEGGSSPSAPPLRGRTRAEQMAELREALAATEAQQEALRRELARQERAQEPQLAEPDRRN